MLRLVRCSPMLYTTNTNSMMFSLPSLSPKETAYIQLQLATVQAHRYSCEVSSLDELSSRVEGLSVNSKTKQIVSSHLLMERCLAVAEAYQVEDSLLPNFIKLCEKATIPRRVKRHSTGNTSCSTIVFKPFQLQNGLELGEMMGGTRVWLNLSMKNKYRYEQTFSALCNEKEFHQSYKRRLLEVMDSLGLSELDHLVEDLDLVGNGKWSFAEYSQQFYDKVLLELCGVSNLSNKVVSHKYKTTLPYIKDPVNLLRTYYIMQKVLDMDMDVNIRNIALLDRLSALDLVTTLNMMGHGLNLDEDKETRKEMIITGAEQHHKLFIENQFMWSLPVSHCVNILEDIGFTTKEVAQLMNIQKQNKKNLGVLWGLNHKMHEFNMDRNKFVDVMKKRLYLLRKEGEKLGIPNMSKAYMFLIKWEQAVMAIDKAELGNSQFFIWFSWDEQAMVGVYPLENKTNSASRAYLLDYFGVLKDNKEEIKKFDDMFLRIPYAKDVPLRLVVGSVMYLESLGFSAEQIREGYPIMCYSQSILSDYIPRVEAVLGPDWMEKDNALCLLNYFIEVEQKFSYDLIYTGMLDCYEEGLSEEFFSSLQPSHVGQNSSAQPPGHLLAAKTPITAGASRSFHTTSHLRDREEGLKTRKSKIFHIQNPLTWLKIFLKFREIKQHWDPHLDQENFIEGAKYAVEAITSKLEQGEWKELRGLLSRKEFKRLRKEVETEWSDVMRQNVSLEVEQMVKVLITDIRTQQIVENKFCDIDLMVLGLKEQERKTPLVMQMEVRLHREYTEGCLPDWVVTRFRMKNWDKSGQAGNI